MRDLKADLELCNRATPEPWTFHEVEFQCGWDECPYEKKREDNSCLKCDGVEIYQSAFVPEVLTLSCGEYDGMNDADAEFIAQSREGWPYAIERAIKAEALARKLLDVLGRVIPRYLVGRLELDLDSVPEATVVRGEWKLYGNDDDSGMSYWCTVCNFQLSEDLFYSGYKNGRWIENGVFKYCPNCGAKMEVK